LRSRPCNGSCRRTRSGSFKAIKFGAACGVRCGSGYLSTLSLKPQGPLLAGNIVQVRLERKALSAAVSPTCCSGREQRSKTASALNVTQAHGTSPCHAHLGRSHGSKDRRSGAQQRHRYDGQRWWAISASSERRRAISTGSKRWRAVSTSSEWWRAVSTGRCPIAS